MGKYLICRFRSKYGISENNQNNRKPLTRDHYLKPHELTSEQSQQLDAVQREFLSVEENGLGKTHLEIHNIELIEGAVPVKDRNFPISPAGYDHLSKQRSV